MLFNHIELHHHKAVLGERSVGTHKEMLIPFQIQHTIIGDVVTKGAVEDIQTSEV